MLHVLLLVSSSAVDNSSCSKGNSLGFVRTAGPALTMVHVDDASACCSRCDGRGDCLSWSWLKPNTCYLKPNLEPKSEWVQCKDQSCSSGHKLFTPTPSPSPSPTFPAPPNARNILFIAIDDIRPDLGLYGSHVETPNLDAFAKTSMTFDNAYIQYSFCCPSRNSFMSGGNLLNMLCA